MDPRFTLQPNLMVDQGAHLYAAGGGFGARAGPAPASFQPFYTGFEQTLHSVDEHAIPASFSSSGQAFFPADRLQRGTTMFQELPTSGAASGIGLTPGHHDLDGLNSSFQLVNRTQEGTAEIGLSGFQSAYAPSYTDVSGLGHGYRNNAPVYVYQPYPRAQIHAEPDLLPIFNSSEFASRNELLPKQGLHHEYSNAGFLARRREVDHRIKSERQRVLDQRRELHWTQDVKAFPARERSAHDKLQTQTQKFHKVSKNSGSKKSKGEALQANRQKANTWCSICLIECNSPQVLQSHIGGKKHKSQVKAKNLQGENFKKKSEEAVRETVEKNNEKIVGTKDQAIRKAKIEKGIRKRARRAERRRALEEEKAERDGAADAAINKALLEIQKIGADFTVDGVCNELKTDKDLGDLKEVKAKAVEEFVASQKEVDSKGVLKEGKDEEIPNAGKTFNAVNEMEEGESSGNVKGGTCEATMLLDSVKFESMETQSKAQEAAEIIEEKVRQDMMDSVKASMEMDTNVAGMDLHGSEKEDVLGNRSFEISSSSPPQTISSPLKSKKADVGALVHSVTVRCEVCAVTCRNATVYETHLKGEKHAERLKKSLEGIKGKPAKIRKVVGK